MPTANLAVIPPTLPSGFCPTGWQQLINEGVGKAIVQFTSSIFTVVISAASAPGAADRDKLWFNTNDDRIYRYHDGAWLSEHPEAPNGLARRMFVGTLTQLQTYDGGDSDSAGDASGPMWERDTDFNDRIPMGVGSSVATAVGTNYGDADGQITLTEANLPAHKHFCARGTNNLSATPQVGATDQISYNGGGMSQENYTLLGISGEANVGLSSDGLGTSAAVNVLNPVRGVYIVKRTSRIYFKAT